MSSKLHVWLHSGKLHQQKGKLRQFGQCCYIAVAIIPKTLPLKLPVWNNDRLHMSQIPHARSTVDRKYGSKPIWNEHLHLTSHSFTDQVVIALRDETIFEYQFYSTKVRPIRRRHKNVGHIVIPLADLKNGNVFDLNNNKKKKTTEHDTSHKSAQLPKSPNNHAVRTDDTHHFISLKLFNKKGVCTATIWLRMQASDFQ